MFIFYVQIHGAYACSIRNCLHLREPVLFLYCTEYNNNNNNINIKLLTD